jgi:plasmid stabilization system protein ParE
MGTTLADRTPELNDPALREIIESPYRIVYRVRADLIEIVTVVHTAEEFPVESVRGAL